MNKMILVAAMACTSVMAMADAQFCEMALSDKTTLTKSGQVKMVACDCGTLNKGIPYTSTTNAFGCFFWNETSKKPLNVKLSWPICNRIDSSATKAEVVWTLTSDDGTFNLTGAGFGSIKDIASKDPCMLVNSCFPFMSRM